MSNFIAFFEEYATSPTGEAEHEELRESFAERVRASHFRLMPPTSANGSKNRLLVGVALWSRADMELLDGLDEAALGATLFDVSLCRSQEDFDRIIPGITPVFQTPVVGHWDGTQLLWKGSGAEAREYLNALCTTPPHRAPATGSPTNSAR